MLKSGNKAGSAPLLVERPLAVAVAAAEGQEGFYLTTSTR